MVKRFFISLFILGCALYLQPGFAASIRAYVDRGDIRVNESFNLIFEAEESVDDDPDFSPLTLYFDILNQSQSSNMTIVNGNFSRKTVWNLTLMAKKPGNYTIPAIEFGSDRSSLVSIKVLPASKAATSQNANLFLETEVEPKTAYVQSQIIYTVRLFRAIDIQSASLSEPSLSDADAVVVKLGEDRHYRTERNNRSYIVSERKYAIFPQQSGELTIEPIEFTGQIMPQRHSFFDPMPFSSKTTRLYTDKVELHIKPIPDNYQHSHWLPASDLKITESFPDNSSFKAGDPITRSIKIEATGLTASQLPEIGLDDIKNLKQYPDQPVTEDRQQDDGIVGVREEKIALIPTEAGEFILPAVEIPWWNTQTNKVEIARIEARTIHVTGGAATQSPAPAQVITMPKSQQPDTSDNAATSDATAVAAQPTTNTWMWISLLLLAAWLLTLLAWYRSRQPRVEQTTDDIKAPPRRNNRTQLKRQLKSACNESRAELCKQLLLDWAQQYWPEKRIQNIGQITQYVTPELAEQIHALNQVLYGSTTADWQAQRMYQLLESFDSSQEADKSSNNSQLPPLFKLQQPGKQQKP